MSARSGALGLPAIFLFALSLERIHTRARRIEDNMTTTLYIVRGLPGSGKTTVADEMMVSDTTADDFFIDRDGVYRFDSDKISAAHAWCLSETSRHIWEGRTTVVHNTFTQRWEMEPYILLAERLDVRLVVVSLFDGGLTDEDLAARNSHNVPIDAITRMRDRFEHDWRNGNPLPPKERLR